MEDLKYIQTIENEEIEAEGTNNDEGSVGPFDPNDIDVDISVVNLGSLLDKLEYN